MDSWHFTRSDLTEIRHQRRRRRQFENFQNSCGILGVELLIENDFHLRLGERIGEIVDIKTTDGSACVCMHGFGLS